jgi:acetate kinase
VFPSVPHVAVFDTAFHQTLSPQAFLYGLPYELYERERIRRYGFHGTSHAYACLAGASSLGRKPEELRIITCHLGAGASVCAIDRGRSVDTSMGFTPAEGLVMATRCGDLDSAVVGFLEQKVGLDSRAVQDLLNRQSGMLGLAGLGSDMKEIERRAEAGHDRATLALSIYAYRLKKYLGAYAAAMGGVDLVVFTGGVGQGSVWIRREALAGLEFMGIELDERRNLEARGHYELCRISSDNSRVVVLIVPANEEWMMAREALRVFGERGTP